MKIYVRTVGGRRFLLDPEPSDTLRDVMAQLQRRYKLAGLAYMCFVHPQKGTMAPDARLSDYNIGREYTLQLGYAFHHK